MKVEKKILDKLIKGEDFPIAGGELVITTRLAKVVSGVNVYNIVLEHHTSSATETPDLSFDSLDMLMEYANGNAEGTSLHICSECGDIPTETGYYINNETGEEFCCYNCLMKNLNKKYGFTWSTMMGDSDSFEVWLKIPKSEAEDLEDYKKVDGEYWRRADIEYICPFEKDGGIDEIFGDISFEEVDDVLL